MKSTVCVFGREIGYSDIYTLDRDIKVLKSLYDEVAEPQILSNSWPDIISFDTPTDDNFIANSMIEWMLEKLQNTTKCSTIYECILASSSEDEGWTRERNKGYTDILYRKIKLNPDVCAMLRREIVHCVQMLNEIKHSMDEKETQKKAQFEREKKQWSVLTVHSSIDPHGEKDGYFDATYKSEYGVIIRIVGRDVFDFGSFYYPKRVEGTEAVFDRSEWTADEVALCTWLSKHGRFHGIRM